MEGNWGLGIGDWGLGIGPNPQSPIPNPQSPIPIIRMIKIYLNLKMFFYFKKFSMIIMQIKKSFKNGFILFKL